MASQAASSGPTPAAPGGGVQLPPTAEQLQTAFDHGIWYLLSLWPALHVACQNGWGGPDSSEKKDWFAGAVSDLFAQRPETDFEDLVVFLLQVVQDEFDLNVEDDTEEEVARSILVLKKRLFEDGDVSALRELEQRWKNRGQMKTDVQVEDRDIEGDEDEWNGFGDEDVDMQDAAPDLVSQPKKEKPQPEVDDDGFTKVVGRRNR